MRFIIICLIALLGISFLFLFDVGSVDLLSKNQTPQEESNASEKREAVPKFTSGREIPHDEKEYFSKQYGFSMLYPAELQATNYNEPGGATTIILQNVKSGLGFQIFIIPYEKNKISPERLRQDIPSGVQKELQDVSVDGATGAIFYSENVLLGETYEVWFIHGGYLYEITTLKTLKDWLDEIMTTWFFL